MIREKRNKVFMSINLILIISIDTYLFTIANLAVAWI